MIKKGTLVQIRKIVLEPNQRSPHIPEDTKKHPYVMWIKGKLLDDAKLGDVVSIETQTKRIETGIMVSVEPYYAHSFGKYVKIIDEVKDLISKETEHLS